MPKGFVGGLLHGWNAFTNRNPTRLPYDYGQSSSRNPTQVSFRYGTERSMVSSIYNRIGIDVAAVSIQHVRIDKNGRYAEEIKSSLNECLKIKANIDQTGRAFIQDVAMSLCDEGSVAIVPVDTTFNPENTNTYDINSMRTGKILEWYPSHVRVDVYNEKLGKREELFLPKSMVAIIENPLYAVMNEPNSTLKRLIHKLNLLDAIDEQSGSGKLDLIFQLPYVIKTEARRVQAEKRRESIEQQLSGSKYGIAYTDGSERVTQLNRPAENNLMAQITYLTSMLYSQLGMTENVFNGTADEAEMLNYYNRTIEPILAAITGAMNMTFLTKTARTQGQALLSFREPFKLVPVNNLADIVDKFTRNEVLSSNEVRAIIGYKPVDDPKADELRNKNINMAKGGGEDMEPVTTAEDDDGKKEDVDDE